MSALTELLEKRKINRKREPFNRSMLHQQSGNVLKMISHSTDFSSVLKEIRLDRILTSSDNNDVEANVEQDIRNLLDMIKAKLASDRSLHGANPEEVLESILIQAGQEFIQQNDVDGMERLLGVLDRCHRLGVVSRDEFREDLRLRELTSPRIAILLHDRGLVSVEAQFETDWYNHANKIGEFLEAFSEEARGATSVAKELTARLVDVAFKDSDESGSGGNEGDEDRARKRKKLVKLMEKMLMIIVDNCEVMPELDAGWVGCCMAQSRHAARSWAVHAVGCLLRKTPHVDISVAIKHHQEYKERLTTSYRSLFIGLISCTSDSLHEVVELILSSIRRTEVNWPILLGFISVMLEVNQDVHPLLCNRLIDLIGESLEKKDANKFVSGLLTSRHACLTKSVAFPGYTTWFNKQFVASLADASDHPLSHVLKYANSIKFLFATLTSLVPHEPSYALRVHTTQWSRVPSHIRELEEDYRLLARTALQDAHQSEANLNVVITEEDKKAACDIIQKWRETGKLPQQIQDAMMFRKPYYLSQLLPAVMTAACGEDGQSSSMPSRQARDEFIEMLNARGKIPSHMYSAYKADDQIAPERTPKATTSISLDSKTVDALKEKLDLIQNLPSSEFATEVDQALESVRSMLGDWAVKAHPPVLYDPSSDIGEHTPAPKVIAKIASVMLNLNKDRMVIDRLLDAVLSHPLLLQHLLHKLLNDKVKEGHAILKNSDLFGAILLKNPLIQVADQGQVRLNSYILSVDHGVVSAKLFGELCSLIHRTVRDHSLSMTSHWRSALKLHRLRNLASGLTDVHNICLCQPLTSPSTNKMRRTCSCSATTSPEDLEAMLRLQLKLDSSEVSLNEATLYRMLLQGAQSEWVADVVVRVLFQDKGHGHRHLALFSTLQSFPSISSSLVASLLRQAEGISLEYEQTLIQLLQTLPLDRLGTSLPEAHVDRLIDLILTTCQSDERLFLSLDAATVISLLVRLKGDSNWDVKDIPIKARASLAYYHSLDILRLPERFEASLRPDFEDIFAWNSKNEHGSNVNKLACQIGISLLAECYLIGFDLLHVEANDLPNLANVWNIIRRLQDLGFSTWGKDHEEMKSYSDNWMDEISSPSIRVVSKMMVTWLFSRQFFSTSSFLLSAYSNFILAQKDLELLSPLEVGLVHELVVNRLSSFTGSQLKQIRPTIIESLPKDMQCVVKQLSNI